MSTFNSNPPPSFNYGPGNTPVPLLEPSRPRKPKPKWILPAALLVGGLMAGHVIGATTTVLTTASKSAEAPASCVEALELADEVFGYASEAMDAAADGFDAASRFSASGIRQAGEDMGSASANVKKVSPKYKTARAACVGD